MTPDEFERLVVHYLRKLGARLKSFTVEHQASLEGPDGEFDLDAVATFEALGLDFTVVVECKHHRNPIKRELVQVLADKVSSLHAQKGVLFSTASFQSGAIEYALARHIGLVHFTEGGPTYETKSHDGPEGPKRPYDVYFVTVSESGNMSYSSDVAESLRSFLFQSGGAA